MSQPVVNKQGRSCDEAQSFVLQDFMPFKVTVLSNKLSHLMARAYSEEFGVTIPEWRVLALISQYREVKAQLVVDETPLDKVAVSRAVASLVEKRLVLKRSSEEDRRAALLRLSPKGEQITRKVQRISLGYEEQTMSVLSHEERQVFHDLVNRLIEQAETIRA